MSIARVQPRGQVTIPQGIREACGIEPGTDLFFAKTGPGTFECHILPPRRSILQVASQYAGDGVAPDVECLREEMGDELARERLPEPARETSTR